MPGISQEQLAAAQPAGWTEDEISVFAQALVAFRDGLTERQQEAFTAILAAAGATANRDDAQGYLIRPTGQPWTAHPFPPADRSHGVVIAIIAILIG
jgi:hypothetical protein